MRGFRQYHCVNCGATCFKTDNEFFAHVKDCKPRREIESYSASYVFVLNDKIESLEIKLKAISDLLDRIEPELKEKRKDTAGLGIMEVIFANIREILK
jgi:hypothetical protein